jgi:hypothetical protein
VKNLRQGANKLDRKILGSRLVSCWSRDFQPLLAAILLERISGNILHFFLSCGDPHWSGGNLIQQKS